MNTSKSPVFAYPTHRFTEHRGHLQWLCGAGSGSQRASRSGESTIDRAPETSRREPGSYPGRTLMARATTRIAITSDSAAWIIIVSLAHLLTGRVSVGLNAVVLVNDRYR